MAIQSRNVYIHTKSDFGWASSNFQVRSLSQLATAITTAVQEKHALVLPLSYHHVEERISAALFDTGLTRGLFDVWFGGLQISVKLSYMDGHSVVDWRFNTIQECNALFFKH